MQSAEEELVIGRSVSYCFLHLTLQEYLAALHWSRMGSEDMVRLVSETSLFPLDTLVRDGITKAAGYHWPALYFLSGLTKLTSVPVELLKTCLAAADNKLNEEDTKKDTEKYPFLLPVASIQLVLEHNIIRTSFNCCLNPNLVIWLMSFSEEKQVNPVRCRPIFSNPIF